MGDCGMERNTAAACSDATGTTGVPAGGLRRRIIMSRSTGPAGTWFVASADSLTTFGDTRLPAEFDRTPDKIIKYQGTYIGLCGSAAHQLVFESLLAKQNDLDFSNKAGIFETFRKLHPILKEQHFLNPKEEEDDPYESTQITALVANPSGIFGVYSMREVFEYTRFWAAGTGREFALGAMYSQYDRLRTAEAIARAGIDAGAMFDKNSGLPLTIYTLAADP